MRKTVSFIASTMFIWLCLGNSVEAQRIIIENLNGSVTRNEIQAFKSFMQSREISDNNVGNDWVYGNSGKDTEALGLMFEVTGDIAILDRMIQFADGALSIRNNANSGRLIWTGKRELCWPNKDITAADAGYCGTESGDVVAHIAYCAKLILQTPTIWNTRVGVGDPKGYGATYKARALKYITEMDRTIDSFLLRWFVVAADSNHFRYPDTPQYGALGERYERNRGDAVPWNQQTMLAGGFLRLADCHAILGNDPSRVTRYDAIVRSSIAWFLGDLHPGTRNGHDVYDWGYSLGRRSEDTGHGGYDIWGLWRAYEANRFSVPRATMIKFANTLFYVMWDPSTRTFFSRVDGTNGAGDSSRSSIGASWLFLSEFLTNPDLYTVCATANRSGAETRPLDAAMILWLKDRRAGRLDIHQAEDATLSGPIMATLRQGFTGSGYADFQNASGDFIEWNVNITTAGTYILGFRYANGAGANRPLSISVNGNVVNNNLAFPGTGSWSTWSEVRTMASLPEGSVKIRARATGFNGANIDYLMIR